MQSKYAVVRWITTNGKIEYSTVPVSDFFIDNINDLKIGNEYNVRYNNRKYKAEYIMMGENF